MPPLDYEDSVNVAGEMNFGGMQRKVYVAPLAWFTTVAPLDPIGAAGDSVKITGNHVFASGKGFVEVVLIPETVQYNNEPNGEVGSQGQTHKIEGALAGHKAENEEFFAWAKNDEFIAVAVDPDGTMIQVGSENLPARIKKKGGTGLPSAGKRQQDTEIMAYQDRMQFYEGTLTIKP